MLHKRAPDSWSFQKKKKKKKPAPTSGAFSLKLLPAAGAGRIRARGPRALKLGRRQRPPPVRPGWATWGRGDVPPPGGRPRAGRGRGDTRAEHLPRPAGCTPRRESRRLAAAGRGCKPRVARARSGAGRRFLSPQPLRPVRRSLGRCVHSRPPTPGSPPGERMPARGPADTAGLG